MHVLRLQWGDLDLTDMWRSCRPQSVALGPAYTDVSAKRKEVCTATVHA